MTAAEVQAKLKAKGQAMTLTRTVAGAYDPVAGAMSVSTSQTFTVFGVTTNYNAQMKPDSMILAGDKQVIMDAVSVEPLPGDTLTFAGATWSVIAADASAPAGVALLYKVQVRK